MQNKSYVAICEKEVGWTNNETEEVTNDLLKII